MATNFPTGLDSNPGNPTPNETLAAGGHANLHGFAQDAIVAIETYIGIIGSAVTSTLTYLLTNVASIDPGHKHTFSGSITGTVPVNRGGTNTTSYSKGDLLVASAAAVLTKLGIGTDGFGIIADSSQTTGMKWGAVAKNIDVQVFTANGTWTKPANATQVYITMLAGGGGGGGGGAASGTAQPGGGGGLTQIILPASVLGATETVTVGAGGTGAAASGNGVAGGDTTFGTHAKATGGGGGGGNGGAAGTAGSGTIAGGAGGASSTLAGSGGGVGGTLGNPGGNAGSVTLIPRTGGTGGGTGVAGNSGTNSGTNEATGGSGGGGGGGTNPGTGGTGGAGGFPGGGGGGGGVGSAAGGAGGAGARGVCVAITLF